MVKEKRCPKCNRVYFDETLNYCLADGSFLYFPEELAENATGAETELLNAPPVTEEAPLKPTDAPTEVLEIPAETQYVPIEKEKSVERLSFAKRSLPLDPIATCRRNALKPIQRKDLFCQPLS